MVVLAGIDEAGFGPILGPMVVSSSVFSVPDNLIKADLWQSLRKSVGKNRKHLAGRLLITDSKKAHTKQQPVRHLQRAVLSCLSCLGKKPATLTDLLSLLCPDCLERLQSYPWYQRLGSNQMVVNEADIKLASAVLADDLSSNDIELLGLDSCCLDVAHYNNMVANVKNKSSVLFTATSQLIQHVIDNFPGEDIQIIIDRQGGRVHYRKNLQRMFSNMDLTILKETSANSSYELAANGKSIRLHFVIKADENFLPVSLASMVSKYLRELLIGNINSYFRDHQPQLKPTAGYWKDGLRFIKDLKTHAPDLTYDSNQLIRCR